MTAAALALRDVTVRHGRTTVLDVPELELRAGETVAVIGPNGAGKSTLLGVLGLTLPPSTGSVLIDGEPAGRPLRALRRRVVSQLQESLLLAGTVAWNVALPLRLRGLAAAEISARVARWARAFGITPLLERRVAGLSGGEARRVCLARAFACEPDALLIDEPLAGVDAPFREEALAMLSAALRERRFTTIMVTHDLADGLRLADRLAILVGGRVRQLGSPGEVLSVPADPDVARLVGVDTYLPGVAEAAGVRLGTILLPVASPLAAGADAWVAIRPEEVTLHAAAAPGLLPATVLDVRPRGATRQILLDAGFPVSALVFPSTVESLGLRAGRQVWARIEATAIPRRRV